MQRGGLRGGGFRLYRPASARDTLGGAGERLGGRNMQQGVKQRVWGCAMFLMSFL